MADTIVMPLDARLAALEAKRLNYLNTLTLRLFKNDYTPTVDSVVGDFTVADFPGYAGITLNDFGASYGNTAKNAESDTGVHTFTCTGAPSGGVQHIYGWYTVDGAGDVGPAARFAAPVPIDLTGAGQSISIQILYEDGGLA